MSKSMTRILTAAALLAILLPAARAHHAAHAFFGGPMVTIEGTLTGVRIMNPHSYFRVTMDDGTEWVFETAGSGTMMRNDGVTEEDFPIDTRVSMRGDSNKEGRKSARIQSIVLHSDIDDSLTLYFIGTAIPNEDWAQEIGASATPCNTGTIARCFSISGELRADMEAKYSDSVDLW